MNQHKQIAVVPASAKQQAHTLYEQMERCLEANPYGGSNPNALRQLQTLARNLEWTSTLFLEKASSFVHWAEILYSPRKHAAWNTPRESGAGRIAHFMRCELVSIGDILGRMDNSP